MNPRVVQVKPLPNYMLEIEFSNKQTKKFDVNPYLKFPVFEPLSDVAFFNQVKVNLGTVAWNQEIDFCPDTLYLESQ